MCGADRITFLTIQFLSNNIFLFVQHYFDPHIYFFFRSFGSVRMLHFFLFMAKVGSLSLLRSTQI